MTKTWDAMTLRERDAALAIAVGYFPCGCSNPECDLWEPPAHLHDGQSYRPFPTFTTSLDAMRRVEDEIERRTLWRRYTMELADLATTFDDLGDDGTTAMWRLIRALPSQRAEAAWRVLK